jgi:hypothetical protein
MNCSPATRQSGSSSLVCRGQEGTTFPLPRSLVRHCCACSSPKACATVRRSPCAGRTSTSPTAFCGSVALSHGSTGTWSLVSPRRSAHALTCPSPPRLWRSWVGQGEPSGRAGQGGLDLVLDGPRVHHGARDGSRHQERTAGDQRRGQGFGHQRCRPAHVEARHAHARGRRATAYRLGATRALLRRSHRRRVRPPSTEGVPSAVQRLSAAMGW